jgi:predicted permease
MGTLWQDIKYGFRMLARSPGFTTVAIISLALGIGANTTVFSVVRGVLWRPLPFAHPEQLVQIDMFNAERNLTAKGTSFLNFEDWHQQNNVFTEMAAVQNTTFNLTGDGEPQRIHGWRVSSRFFALMGVQPVRGRVIGDDRESRERLAVVSQGLWERRFGAASDILERHLTLDGESYAVIGVMPAGFNLPGDTTELWIPLTKALMELPRGQSSLFTLARLKQGVSLSQAQSEMNVIAQRLAEQFPDDNAGWGVQLHPLHNAVAGSMRPALLILFVCVALVLLIVCLNVGSLALAKGATRRGEVAIRVALGASRFRVVRLCMIQHLLLSLLGGASGLLTAMWGLRLVQNLPAFSEAPTLLGGMTTVPSNAVRVDGVVLLFLFLASVVAGTLFGLFPALRATCSNPNQTLKAGACGAGRSQGGQDRFRDGLVVVQVAMASVLLVGAGLLTRSLTRLMRVDPGFRSDNVLYAEVSLSPARYREEVQVTAFWRRLCEQVSALPSVDSASVTNSPPFAMNFMTGFSIEGRPAKNPGQFDLAMYRVATPDYFRSLGIPLLRGRVIAEGDVFEAPPVAVIDNEMAQRFWPGNDPIGAKINLGGRARTVVGIVGAVKHYGLDADLSPTLYLPQMQEPNTRAMTLVVRTTGNPSGVAAAIRTAVKAVDPDQPVARIRSMDSIVAGSVSNRRLLSSGLGGFAVLALGLVAIGLYGVVSLSVARRTQEIGIRMALGARMPQVLLLTIRRGMGLALAGLSIGVVAALALSRVMTSLLYEVKPTDPPTFAGVAGLLLAVACLACYLPARRAARIDPMEALRYE